ncbi:hypothetical protein Cgig2_002075 [Carnegiea gigantea]|uniref:Uncharacterized protein n=1 Tax=Carnegiea gigantea TaxID=171969 RepID=A0A9Q1Q6Y3_9CARY|nr:hypothetical protein Cgig2_002075 [Carnegiea gigantea]
MEAANSARPLPTFDDMPTAGCEPSHRHTLLGHIVTVTSDQSNGADALQSRRPNLDRPAKSTTASMSYVTHSRTLPSLRNKSKPRSPEERSRRSIWRSPIYPRKRALELSRSLIRFSKAETDGVDLTTFNTRATGKQLSKAWRGAQPLENLQPGLVYSLRPPQQIAGQPAGSLENRLKKEISVPH